MWAVRQAAGKAHDELMAMGRDYGWTQENVEAVMGHTALKLTKNNVEVLMEFTKAGVLRYISVRTHDVFRYVGTRETKNKRRAAWIILGDIDPVAAAKREAKYP